jgi:hypothetical protein
VAPQQPTRICQLSIVEWSTCLPRIKCRTALSSCHVSATVSAQSATDVVPRVTLTMVTRVTPGLVQLSSHTPNQLAMCHLLELPCHLYGPYDLYNQHATWHCTDCTVIPFFACLPFRTERNILLIWSSFDEVNIPSESGRRDRRNGVGFVGFRALSFLSIFKPCQASGSDSGSILSNSLS